MQNDTISPLLKNSPRTSPILTTTRVKNKQTKTRNYKRLKVNLCQKIKKGGRENKETSLISFLKGKATVLVQPDESQTWDFEEKAITMTL